MLRNLLWRTPHVLTSCARTGLDITPVTTRLIDIANGRVSQTSITRDTLTTPQHFLRNSERWNEYALPACYEADLLSEQDYQEPRLVQEVMSLAHAAAAVLASLTGIHIV